ncbi:serine/threonine-protein kinase [Nocardioides humi]|uniref:non-specific serine/threonine protein kinase n=1 Tax=Nocardioides humi TaxID=449461 RepID=A0ABN2BBH3_9ACTN|nr:serine/threonine-protein kinase [Nocardioides humi]
MSDLGPGSVVGDYRLGERIGMGGMGVVHGGVDLRLDRRVAIKILSGRLAGDPAQLARFDREARALSTLDSPYVVRIFDHGVAGGAPYIVTQYVGGGDLGRLLSVRGPMPVAAAARVCGQVARALAAAHAAGIVHRDVKPGNVLIADPEAPRPHALLADFGVAHTRDARLTVAGAVVGTADYLAPELADGAEPSTASDVYALGCLLWACLSGGAPPYGGSEIEVALAHRSAPVPQLPGRGAGVRQVNTVLRQTLAKHPADRTTRADRVAELLREIAEGADGADGAGGAPGRRTVPRVAVGIAAAVVAVVAVAALGTGVHLLRDRGPTPGESTRPAPDVSSGAPAAEGPELTVTAPAAGATRADLTWRTGVTGFSGPATATSDLAEGALPLLADLDGTGAAQRVDLRLRADGRGRSVPVVTRHDDGRVFEGTALPARRLAVAVADVDGDGDDDLALVGARAPLRVWVMPAEEGGYGPPALWLEADRPRSVVAVEAGDLDGDGDDDLVVRAAGRPDQDAGSLELLRAEAGGRFAATPPALLQAGPLDDVTMRVADVDGDGRAEAVLYVAPYRDRDVRVDVLTYADDGWSPPVRWLAYEGADIWLIEDWRALLTVVDVDADGRDDLVRISGPDPDNGWLLDVLRSSGQAFERPPTATTWACGEQCSLAPVVVWARAGLAAVARY